MSDPLYDNDRDKELAELDNMPAQPHEEPEEGFEDA